MVVVVAVPLGLTVQAREAARVTARTRLVEGVEGLTAARREQVEAPPVAVTAATVLVEQAVQRLTAVTEPQAQAAQVLDKTPRMLLRVARAPNTRCGHRPATALSLALVQVAAAAAAVLRRSRMAGPQKLEHMATELAVTVQRQVLVSQAAKASSSSRTTRVLRSQEMQVLHLQAR